MNDSNNYEAKSRSIINSLIAEALEETILEANSMLDKKINEKINQYAASVNVQRRIEYMDSQMTITISLPVASY